MKELADNELLEFLLTAELNEDYKSEEFKYLLHKFRYFYRVLHGKNSNLIGQKDLEIQNFKKEVEFLNTTIHNLRVENTKIQDILDLKPKTRKLTFRERLSGKITL